MYLTRSLEDYRREQLLDIGEFAHYLGVTEQTYRRLLDDPERVRMATKRQIRERIGVSPYLIAELSPQPSSVLQAQVQTAIDEADTIGWVAYDPNTYTVTGERLSGDGNPQ